MTKQQTIEDGSAVAPIVKLATGFGWRDTHALIVDGKPNLHPVAGSDYTGVTGAEIAAMVERPPCVEKEKAQWVIPSTYAKHDARDHDVQRQNGAFKMLVLDVDENDLDLSFLVETVQKVVGTGVSILAYSTKSSKPGDRRWRVIVPVDKSIPGADYPDTSRAFFDCLIDASKGELIPDRALSRVGQIFYLPNRGEFYEHQTVKAKRLKLTPDHPVMVRLSDDRTRAAVAKGEADARRAKKATERAARGADLDAQPTEVFNDRHDVADLLARYGYQQDGNSNHWRSPYQKSGSYATQAHEGYWVSLSGSDADMAVGAESSNGNRFGDAFDLYCHFEHGGDFKKAVRTYAEEAGLSGKQDTDWHQIQGYANPTAIANPAAYAPNFDHAPAPTASDPEPKVDGWAVQTAADFTADFVAPEYIIDGIVQRGRIYTLTAPTGSGKTAAMLYASVAIATGMPFCTHDVEAGDVLFMAGENPDDVRARVIATLEFYDINPNACRLHFIAGTFSIRQDMEKLRAEAAKLPDLKLCVIDTFAAYFDGDDENSNAQALDFARLVRKIAAFPAKPAVIMPAHPVKNATRSNLSPKGGSSLLNEVDGNLTLWNDGGILSLHWQGKFRGAEFEPLSMELQRHESSQICDNQGRIMPTILAKPMLMARASQLAKENLKLEDRLLISIRDRPAISLEQRGTDVGGVNKQKVGRVLVKMAEQKLVRKFRTNWELTKEGERALEIIENGGGFAPEI